MLEIAPGTEIALGTVASSVSFAAPLARVRRQVATGPHCAWVLADAGGTPLLLSILDPRWVATPGVFTDIEAAVARARTVTHKNLLVCHGVVPWERTHAVVWDDPGGKPLRDHLARMLGAGRAMDAARVQTIAAHASRAIGALHRVMPHGFVSLDTIHVGKGGRIFVGEAGVGAVVPRAPDYGRFHLAGLVPVPPECREGRRWDVRSDVYALAACCFELLTGQAPPSDGRPPFATVDVPIPDHLIAALSRALSPDPNARFESMRAFRAAVRGAPAPEQPRGSDPASAGGRPAADASRPIAAVAGGTAAHPRTPTLQPFGEGAPSGMGATSADA
ncbi:MAG: hypothetical protein D6705_13035, partial [Deltaproteobacteria bacterium]